MTLDLVRRLAATWRQQWQHSSSTCRPSPAIIDVLEQRAVYADRIGREVSFDEWTDLCSQTFVVLLRAWALLPAALRARQQRAWLVAQADPLWRKLLESALECGAQADQSLWVRSLGLDEATSALVTSALRDRERASRATAPDRCAELTYDYESLLQTHDGRERRRKGVYYTPPALVRFIVRNVQDLLRTEFGRLGGWIDQGSWAALSKPGQAPASTVVSSDLDPLQVLDPAAGTGAFLVEVVRQAHAAWQRAAVGQDEAAAQGAWNAWLPNFVARLQGFELMLPACALAQLNLAVAVAETGCDFSRPLPLVVTCRNALLSPAPYTAFVPPASDAPLAVVLGNPPFSGISENNSAWIAGLLRGRGDPAAPADSASYFHLAGIPLGERKVWLNDDYIKFFRVAQWQVERVGRGLLALVSNHGFLDAVTCRAMRASLLQTFPRIAVVDLHGNAKRREKTANGMADANLFSIEQGVAVTFARRIGRSTVPDVLRCDVWGSAAEKQQVLSGLKLAVSSAGGGDFRACRPEPPHYLFTPAARATGAVERTWLLSEIMPFSSTAPVTARDHFVIAFTRDELQARMDELRNPARSDESLRQQFFHRTRSRRYPPGDTRGWKLAAARLRAAQCGSWDEWIQTCLYRPFDQRYVFWADWMIDWPRPSLSRHWEIPGNLALITRRQMLPDQECNFFWVADRHVLDGVLRSDNRGSESVFPLLIREGESWRENLAPAFREELGRIADRGAAHAVELSPHDVLAWLYATFQSPTYRKQYAARLRIDFPPVPLPRDAEQLQTRIATGRRLLALHLGRVEFTAELPELHAPEDSVTLAAGYPRFRPERIWLNRTCWLGGIDERVWQYRAGIHQVCRKWLADRKGRGLDRAELQRYRQLVAAISQTLRCVHEELA